MPPQTASSSRAQVLTEEVEATALPAGSATPGLAQFAPESLLDLVVQVTELEPHEARARLNQYLPGLAHSGKSALAAIREGLPQRIDELNAQLGTQIERIVRHRAFQETKTAWESLQYWVSRNGSVVEPPARERLKQSLGREIAQLDAMLTRQVDAILHHRDFQKLEASWQGLSYLVKQTEDGENVQIRVLSLTRQELDRDLTRASEFDQSQLFRKVYSDEFDTPGGLPYGVLIGDFEFSNHPVDMDVLGKISSVAAAAFAPFIAAAAPSLFGLDSFAELERPFNLSAIFEQTDYVKWRSFRDSEDARFVGLTAPRVLMRLPYEDDGTRVDGFRFREHVEGPDRSKYLWGNSAYTFGGVLIRAFKESAWLADIRGVPWRDESGRIRRGVLGGGLVTDLPVHSFSTDRRSVAPKCSTEVILSDAQEKELGDLGFIPLCHCKDTAFSVFYGNQSAQKPKKYDRLPATMNAKLSAMLQYMLCISRFAHYLKVIAREKVGSLVEPIDLENFLHRWIQKYVIADDNAGQEVKAEYPLREARLQVRTIPSKPGSYMCVAHLRPHFQLDELTAAVRLETELAPARAH